MTLKINCSDLDTYCEQKFNIRTVPTDIPTQTKTIDLSNNSNQALDNNSFSGLTNVTTIDLSDSVIQTVEDNSFAGLTNLTNLVLRYNNLSSLPAYLFNEQNLKYLDVSWNNQKCNSSCCYLKELEDKGYMDHYTYKGGTLQTCVPGRGGTRLFYRFVSRC